MVFKAHVNQSFQYPACIQVIGASFRELGLEDREAFARLMQNEQLVLEELKQNCGFSEAALVSTCNRFEVVSVAERDVNSKINPIISEKVLEIISKGLGRKLLPSEYYAFDDRTAVRHIFRVASSLDSMVLGEAQILGQIKDSYRRAVALGTAGRYLHHLFQFAFRLAKRVRSNTAVSERGVSVSYVAVRLAERIFGDLKDKSVLIAGSGQVAELVGVHLRSYGCKQIIVANRTLERAIDLASRLEGSAISLGEINLHLSNVDIVIGSLAAMESPIIEISKLKEIRRAKSLLLIDLGVPRNFAKALADIDDVYLYNIDDLGQIADENRSVREEAAKEAEIIVDYGIIQFEKWLQKVTAEPEILDFRARVRAACEEELLELLKEYVPEEERDLLLERISHKISQKISHDITNLIARLPEGRVDQESLLPLLFEEYLKLI